MGIDEVLQRHAGEFGAWQLRHFLLTSAAWALEALHTMVMIFADREPPRFCALGPGRCADPDPCGPPRPAGPGPAGPAPPPSPSGASSAPTATRSASSSRPSSPAACSVSSPHPPSVCAGVFGHLSDSFLGRKGSLLVVCILNTVFGLLTALSPSYWTYVGLRLLTGFSTGGVGLCAFVLATEPVGPTKRGPAGMSTFYFFSGGIAVLSGIAYLFPSWRILYVVTSLPSFLFLILILPFISESPRWYLVRRRTDEAMDVMRAIARANGKDIPNDITLKLDDDDSREQEESNNLEKGVKEQKTERAAGGSIVDVLRTPMTRLRLILTVAINFLCSIVYYGLSLNVVNLKTNLYLSVLLNAVAEMPAFVLTAVLLDRFGRKLLGVGTMWLSGVFCIVGSMVGGYGAMKIVRMASQMGAILAPMVVVLGDKVPFAVFGLSGIVGGILVFYLPETMNKPLYDTMAGMEEAENKILLK
uniref:H(+)/Pi cotransporter n=1 Tax=Ananas comosus var. bracteatus TaxID=296719 RepID=A0A6V7PNB3_ANACO|nr:unnamed protein product [Ananas comosus var. bracteatus]